MIERGSGAGLALETFESDGIAGKIEGQKFQRDKAIEPHVPGLVDDAHAAAAHFGDDAVMGNFREFREGAWEFITVCVGCVGVQTSCNLKRGRFHEVVGVSIELEKGVDFAAEFLVAGTLGIEESTTLAGLESQSAVKEFLGTTPMLRGHFAFTHSSHEEARLSPGASRGPRFPWKL
jgi:hypothetical protein